MDKKLLIIWVLAGIIIAGSLVFAYNEISDRAYNQGIQDATLIINQQILNSLQQNGYIPFVYMLGNETYRINLVPYQNE